MSPLILLGSGVWANASRNPGSNGRRSDMGPHHLFIRTTSRPHAVGIVLINVRTEQ